MGSIGGERDEVTPPPQVGCRVPGRQRQSFACLDKTSGLCGDGDTTMIDDILVSYVLGSR